RTGGSSRAPPGQHRFRAGVAQARHARRGGLCAARAARRRRARAAAANRASSAHLHPVIRTLVRHFVAIAGIAALAGYSAIYGLHLADQPVRSDGFSYYVYLPSWFLYGDPTLNAVADDCCGGTFPEYTAIVRW